MPRLKTILLTALTALELNCLYTPIRYSNNDEILSIISDSKNYKLLKEKEGREGNSRINIKVFDSNNNGKADLYLVYYLGYYNASGDLIYSEEKIDMPIFLSRDYNEDGRNDVTYRYLRDHIYILYSDRNEILLKKFNLTR